MESCIDPRIRVLLSMIQRRKGDVRLRSRDAAKLLGLGEVQLLRLFKRDIKKGFRQYLREMRLKDAARAVTTSIAPLKEIAMEYGYTDTSNFYRDFRLVHGMTPIKMRLAELSPEVSVQGSQPADNA